MSRHAAISACFGASSHHGLASTQLGKVGQGVDAGNAALTIISAIAAPDISTNAALAPVLAASTLASAGASFACVRRGKQPRHSLPARYILNQALQCLGSSWVVHLVAANHSTFHL